jgi:hypothetical protein
VTGGEGQGPGALTLRRGAAQRTGLEAPLVQLLGAHSPIPCTYAGGARSIAGLLTPGGGVREAARHP